MYLMFHLHDGLMSCQHIIPLLISSTASFFKYHGLFEHCTVQRTRQHISPLWSQPLILTPHSTCHPEGGGDKGVPIPPLSWEILTTFTSWTEKILMPWFDWGCSSPTPPYELIFPFPLMAFLSPYEVTNSHYESLDLPPSRIGH